MSANAINFIMIAAHGAFAVALGWWVRKYPNRSKEYPERIRMTKVIMLTGWICIGIGVLVGLVGLTTKTDILPPRIIGAGTLLFGLILLGVYRNFYIVPREAEIAFRTVLGQEHVISYSDIANYEFGRVNRQPIVSIKSIHGVKLGLNTSIYDVSPLLRAIEHHQETGRWPARGEVLAQKQPDPSAG